MTVVISVVGDRRIVLAADSRYIGNGADGATMVGNDATKVQPIFTRFATAVSGQGFLYDPERFDYSVSPRLDRRNPHLAKDQRSNAHLYGQVPVSELILEAEEAAEHTPQSPKAVFDILWAFLRTRLLFTFRYMPHQGPNPQFNLWIAGWDEEHPHGSLLQFVCQPKVDSGGITSVKCEGKTMGSTTSPKATVLSHSADRSITVEDRSDLSEIARARRLAEQVASCDESMGGSIRCVDVTREAAGPVPEELPTGASQ